MADGDWIGRLTSDERFLGLSRDDQVSAFAKVAATHIPAFANRHETEQKQLAATTLARIGIHSPQQQYDVESGGGRFPKEAGPRDAVGGIQSDLIQPADIIANAAGFGLPAMGKVAAEQGTELLTGQALKTGLGTAAGTYSGQLASEMTQQAAEPLIQQIPGQGPVGQLARGTARQAAGIAPVLAPGAIAGGLRLSAEMPAIEAGATEASEARSVALAKEENELRQAAEKGLTGVQTNVGKELGEGSKAIAGERTKQAEAMLPEARRQTIQKAIGRTPQETESAMLGSPTTSESGVQTLPPEVAERRTKTIDAVFAPVRKTGKAYGAQFDAKMEGHTEQPYVAGSAYKQSLDGIDNWIKTNSIDLSGDTVATKLLARARAFAEGKPINPRLLGETPQSWDDLTLDEQEARIATYEQNRAKAFAEQGKKPPNENRVPTGADWKSLRSSASKLMAEGRSGAANSIGYKLRNAIEAQMEDAGIPGMKELNSQYSLYKNVFDDKFFSAISKAQDPVDAAEAIFNNNLRARTILANATPEQKGLLRQLYGDAVNDAHAHGKEFVNFTDQKEALKALFPKDNILNQEGTWLRLPKDEINAGKVIAETPELKGKLENKIRAYTEQEIYNRAVNIQKDIVDQMEELAKPGKNRQESEWAADVARRVKPLNPIDGAKLGMELTSGISPEDIAGLYRAGQPTPTQAAIDAVQQGKLGKVPEMFSGINFVKRRFPIYAGMVLMQLATRGSASPYFEGMLGVGGTIAGTEAAQGMIRRVVQNRLKDPELAENLVRAIGKPAARGSVDVIAKGAAEAAINDLTQKLTGVSAPPRKEPDVNDLFTKPAVREGTDVRVGKPGESHAEIENRMPDGKGKERGFVGSDGKFMARVDARDAIKGLGGDPESHGPHADELAVNANLPPNPPTPITLGNSPMQQFATQSLAKMVPPQKAALYRDYDEAARAYRKGDVAALEPREWLRKGMTPQELADGWRRSRMGRVEAGLSMLPLDQVAQAWQLASDKNDKGDAAAAARVVKQKVADIGWGNVPQQAKAVIAPLIRRMLAPQEEEVNA